MKVDILKAEIPSAILLAYDVEELSGNLIKIFDIGYPNFSEISEM